MSKLTELVEAERQVEKAEEGFRKAGRETYASALMEMRSSEIAYSVISRRAIPELKELLELCREIDLKFKSGNSIPVERATVKAEEWQRIREIVG